MITKRTSAMQLPFTNARRFLWCVSGLIVFFSTIMTLAAARAADAPAAQAPADPVQVVGIWQRMDGAYILELRNPTFDGRLEAIYLNPRPIHVARSGWVLKDGDLMVLVELRDKGYPGSTYTLAYQQDTDRLVGIYFQAVAQQQFEVVFKRVE
jgi:hypothetical protein